MHTQHRGQYVPPVSTVALMEALGATRAARTLGVSTTLLYTARKEGEVSKVVEKAAEGALRAPLAKAAKPAPEPKLPAEPVPAHEETALVLIEVSKSKAPVLERMARGLGAVTVLH